MRQNSSRRLVEEAGDHLAVSLVLTVASFLLRLGILGFLVARARLLFIDLNVLGGVRMTIRLETVHLRMESDCLYLGI